MEWQKFPKDTKDPKDEKSFANIVGMDPFADWLLGEGLGLNLFTRRDLTILIPFMITPLDNTAASLLPSITQGAIGKSTIISLKSYSPEVQISETRVYLADLEFFRNLLTSSAPELAEFRKANKVITLGPPLNKSSLPDPAFKLAEPSYPAAQLPDDTVVVGIIDDGIAIGQQPYHFPDGTSRVHFFWRQDGLWKRGNGLPPTVGIGREIWKQDADPTIDTIDSLLKASRVGGLVDEEAFYRSAGLVSHEPSEPIVAGTYRTVPHQSTSWRLAHGTHVLDLAAGYHPSEAPPNIAIVGVQLPVAATADTSGATLDFYAELGIRYILDRADRLAGWPLSGRKFPVVINFSYGHHTGAHDGTSQLEAFIDQEISTRGAPLSVVLPSGNDNLSRCHAEIDFDKPDATVCLKWQVQPEDLTPTQIEIWTPCNSGDPRAPSRLSLQVETPSGVLSPELSEEDGSTLKLVEVDDDKHPLAWVTYRRGPLPTDRGVFCLCLQPTATLQPSDPRDPSSQSGPTAPAGGWKIQVHNKSLAKGELVQAWILRDDDIYGYPRRGRQSYFDDASYTRFDPVSGDTVDSDHEDNPSVPLCTVKRRGMINALGTGARTIVVGGVRAKDLKAGYYSAGGPVTQPCDGKLDRDGPDVLAVSDDSRVHEGVIAAGSRSGSAVAMNGTSVAAPQITRLISRRMAGLEGSVKVGDRSVIRSFAAMQEAGPLPLQPPLGSKARYGEGRIVIARPDRPPRIDPDP